MGVACNDISSAVTSFERWGSPATRSMPDQDFSER